MSDLKYIAFLAAAWLLLKFGPAALIRRLTMLLLGKSGLEAVGRKALAAQPDRISLSSGPAPKRIEAVNAVGMLERRGFERAGSFEVREMKGINLHLMVKPSDSAMAVIYEHPKAGVWADLACRYEDGTTFTVTSARAGNALEDRPGHPTVRAPGQPSAMLALRLVQERPQGQLKTVTALEFPRVFEQAYLESMAWRKNKGLTAAEVRGSGLERISA